MVATIDLKFADTCILPSQDYKVIDGIFDDDVDPAMKSCDWNVVDRSMIRMGVLDIFANAQEYGNGHDINKSIRFDYSISPRSVYSRIQDECEKRNEFLNKLIAQGNEAKKYSMEQRAKKLLDLHNKRQELGKGVGGYGVYIAALYMDKMKLEYHNGNITSMWKFRKV